MCFETGFKSRQCGGQPDMSRQLLAEFVLGTNKSTWVNNKILKSILKRAGSQRSALASICSVNFHLFAGTDFISQTITILSECKETHRFILQSSSFYWTDVWGVCGIVGHDLGISKNPGYSPECNWPKVKMTSLQLASDWRKLNLQLTPDAKAPQQHYAQFIKREMPL